MFISIAGNIGSGKSSLTKKIAEQFDFTPYFESVDDNPYLKDFYDDMKRWSFNLQVYFLSHRFKTHKEILMNEKSVIQDRSIYEDVEIFAKNLHTMGNMTDRDYANYRQLFAEMTYFLKPPDLLVYLKANTETLVKQIQKRGRVFEKDIDVSYLELLNTSYEEWISNYNLSPILIVPSDNLDFVQHEPDYDFIIDLIKQKVGA
ncbi:MAG: deoxynucleoside kinase [Ignavibacteria bacterium]|nr:deoxynucleoside kinase [Ignavibacteria bacterium]